MAWRPMPCKHFIWHVALRWAACVSMHEQALERAHTYRVSGLVRLRMQRLLLDAGAAALCQCTVKTILVVTWKCTGSQRESDCRGG